MSTDKKTAEWYEQNAAKYAGNVRDPKFTPYHAYYEKPAMYALLPELNGKAVLSIGCGSGEDSAYLKKVGAERSVGIDLSGGLIKIAQETYPECQFRVMNMEKLDFSNESFDFAYSSLAIHYVEDWGVVFKEVFRVLKPGSHFLFSVYHPLKTSMAKVPSDTHSIVRLEISKNIETKAITFTGDYLTPRKIDNAFGKDTVNAWALPLGLIAHKATSAGFLIDHIVEPQPLEGMKEVKPDSYERLKRIPEFVIMRLTKL